MLQSTYHLWQLCDIFLLITKGIVFLWYFCYLHYFFKKPLRWQLPYFETSSTITYKWWFLPSTHFNPCKRYSWIKRTFKRWVNSTKQLLNAGRGHQAPRKVAHCLQKKVGKYIKNKKRDKRGRDGAPSREESLKKREVSKHQETLSLPSLWRALEPQRATL